jgi:predicted rRNA methylase YqxC with S4 and FtsJ domains
LRGSLRQDERVVDLEGVNLASLTARQIPEPVEVVSVDLWYIAISKAVAQLVRDAHRERDPPPPAITRSGSPFRPLEAGRCAA